MLRRFAEALLLVLGFTWGLAPLAVPGPALGGGQGLGVERAYIEGSPAGPHAFFVPLFFTAAPPVVRGSLRPQSITLSAGVLRGERRLFLRLGRLQLEGG